VFYVYVFFQYALLQLLRHFNKKNDNVKIIIQHAVRHKMKPTWKQNATASHNWAVTIWPTRMYRKPIE